MKAHRLFLTIPLLVAATAAADTFELKDGTTLEGTILKTDGADYILEVQVTKSIKDERRVPKADVVKHVAEQKDQTAYDAIARILPTANLQSAQTYRGQIARVSKFIKDHPQSPRVKDAKKILATLQQESAAVAEGGVKYEGKLLSASERAPKAYGLDAGIQAANMKSAAESGDLVGALRAWTVLETKFQGSRAYRENVDLVLQVMRAQLNTVTQSLAGFDARTKSRASGLLTMSGSDRNLSESAIKDEESAYLARVERDKAAGHKWLPLDPYVKQPLDDTKRMLESEIRRLESADFTHLPKSEEAYETAWEAISKPEVTEQEVSAALSAARSASVPQEYVDILTKAAPTPTPPTQ